MAAEFRRKGVNVLLGPVVGPAWRVVRGGRNWEAFTVDPYLSGSLVSESVQGIQAQGVQASVKVGRCAARLGRRLLTVLPALCRQ